MRAVLLDTDVFSFMLKGAGQAQDYQQFLVGNRLVLSFMTVAELFQWAYVRNWGDARIALLEQEMQPRRAGSRSNPPSAMSDLPTIANLANVYH